MLIIQIEMESSEDNLSCLRIYFTDVSYDTL